MAHKSISEMGTYSCQVSMRIYFNINKELKRQFSK